MLIMNLPIGSISSPPGVTHGSLLSASNTSLWSRQHLKAHTLENTWMRDRHNLLLLDGHLLVATRGGDGKARDLGSRLFHHFSTIFYYFQLHASWLKGGAVCGASHAALGESLYLIPKLRSDICQICHRRHSILCTYSYIAI